MEKKFVADFRNPCKLNAGIGIEQYFFPYRFLIVGLANGKRVRKYTSIAFNIYVTVDRSFPCSNANQIRRKKNSVRFKLEFSIVICFEFPFKLITIRNFESHVVFS